MYDQVYHTCTYTCVHVGCPNVHVLYCPAVTLPLFVNYFQEKERGGHNNEDLHFCLAVNPPPPRIRVLRSTKLCCAVEAENSFDRRVSTERWKSCWPRTCCHFKLFSTRLIHECNSFTLATCVHVQYRKPA